MDIRTAETRHSLPGKAGAAALGALLLAATSLPAHADEALADLVEEVSPSVVTVISQQSAKAMPAQAAPFDFEGHPFGEFFRRFGVPEGRQMPRPGPSQGLGSGFVIDSDGLVVTNHHVIDGAEKVTIRLSDKREFTAEVVGSDPLTDLALLKITTDAELPAVVLGDSDAIRVGEDVVAIGNPFGLSSTVTTGIVSAKGRNISDGPYAEFLQTDAAINRGNSGGPLFDMDGEVVGVNSAIYSPSGGSVGLGFAVTSNIVQEVVADLRDDGKVDRGWLGVSIQSVTPDIAGAMGLDASQGALVADVVPDSPADGVLQPGDVIVGFGGAEVADSADLPRLVGATGAGEDSTVTVLRDGERVTLDLTVGEYKGPTASAPEQDASNMALGVTVAPLTETARNELGLGSTVTGVLVMEVAPDSPAAQAGLRRGDVIMKLDGQETDTPQALQSALKNQGEDPALMLINRRGAPLFIAVDIA
ncbi:serine protease Do [Cribrihabitans marinus]|uniref:Probable periplasmic serine endoprotease DegP-like n=1 Tax=Cribrihabitans marinus TaxID=1227549 RepID=A0A1H6QL61_9RHOB|nr:DegQ family serine endoprotease [Cribrihabitans marinus]GGH19266.1 serine protease [Cribrihabitans marinus]SEI44448.1 serine protease Do [Cribrihabitans marinus]